VEPATTGTDASQNGQGPAARVDLQTGELTCPRCEQLKPGDLEIAEAEIRRLRRQVKRLERDRHEDRMKHTERRKILGAIQLWADLTGHPKANINAGDRFDMVVARRREQYPFGDPVEDPPEEPCPTICLAIMGLAAYPYATKQGRSAEGLKKDRHDRLGIALASGEALERFARLGWRSRHHAAA
jgi:hypothetical protein